MESNSCRHEFTMTGGLKRVKYIEDETFCLTYGMISKYQY